jgi:hypothetical protein
VGWDGEVIGRFVISEKQNIFEKGVDGILGVLPVRQIC